MKKIFAAAFTLSLALAVTSSNAQFSEFGPFNFPPGSTGGGGGSPTGAAGGDLTGTYPNPTLAAKGFFYGLSNPGAANFWGSPDGVSIALGNFNSSLFDYTAGVVSPKQPADDCTSGTCVTSGSAAIVTGDAGFTVKLGAHAYTLAQAGTTGFGNNWGLCFINESTTGDATVTATTSVFHAGGETTVLTLAAGDSACIRSDGTNYDTFVSHFEGDGPTISPTALSGAVNDYNPTNLSTARTLRIDGGASDRNITGIAGGYNNRRLRIINVGTTNALKLVNNSGSSTAGNKLLLTADTTLPINASLDLVYDGTTAAWRSSSRAMSDTIAAGTCTSCNLTYDISGRITVAANGSGGSGTNVVSAVSTSQLDKTSDTALATITGLSVALTGGKTYNCHAYLPITSNASGGVKVAFVSDGTLTATSTSFGVVLYGASNFGGASKTTTLGTGVGVTAGTTIATMDGTIVVNVGGSLLVQGAQNASFGTATSFLVNSNISCAQVN